MFARWSRLPFRRCLHYRSSPNSLAFIFGMSAATTAYLTWHLSSHNNRIALDSPHAGNLSGPRTSPTAESNQQSSSAPTDTTSLPGTEADSAPREPEENPPENGGGGAYNPETGEINWDCPCLGGMAHGPCGLQFREAFSCFVFSEVEPKGMDCVDKFKAMQDCFRAHPDVYADEIMDDEEESPVSDDQSSGSPSDEKEKDADSLPSPDDSSSSTPSTSR